MNPPTLAIILAGGKGTRIASLTANKIPKPLIDIQGKPLLGHIIDKFIDSGIHDIVLSTGYDHEKISSFLERYRSRANIIEVVENEPLGTAGALKYAVNTIGINESFYLTNGDTLTSFDLKKMDEFYRYFCPGKVLMGLAPTAHPLQERVVKLDQTFRIQETKLYPQIDELDRYDIRAGAYLVNAGVYIMEPASTKMIGTGFATIDSFIQQLTLRGVLYGFPTDSMYLNVGTPEIYEIAQKTRLCA